MPPITHDKSEEHWDIETGYNEKATNDILSFPYRAHSGGSRGALVVLLNLNASDYDHMCRGPIVGFKGKLTSRKWYEKFHYFFTYQSLCTDRTKLRLYRKNGSVCRCIRRAMFQLHHK